MPAKAPQHTASVQYAAAHAPTLLGQASVRRLTCSERVAWLALCARHFGVGELEFTHATPRAASRGAHSTLRIGKGACAQDGGAMARATSLVHRATRGCCRISVGVGVGGLLGGGERSE